MNLKDYFKLWKKLISLNVKTWLEYRMDFFVGIFAMFISNLTSIVFFWVLFQNIVQKNSWTFCQLVFLSGLSSLVIGIWHCFLVGVAPWRIERHVRSGTFDRLLIQPVNPFVYLLISSIDDDGFGDLIEGLLIVYLCATMSGIPLTISNLFFLGLFIFGAVLIFFSITIFVSTLSFWIIRSGSIGEIIWSLIRFIDLPLDVYNPIITFILTFIIPISFINFYPAELFLGKLYANFAYLTPIVGLVSFILSYKFWKFGIKNYTSTGS
ncbi:MAG: ABC-2 family transporter protein [Candidatus Aenigmatarchaeota archaeon]